MCFFIIPRRERETEYLDYDGPLHPKCQHRQICRPAENHHVPASNIYHFLLFFAFTCIWTWVPPSLSFVWILGLSWVSFGCQMAYPHQKKCRAPEESNLRKALAQRTDGAVPLQWARVFFLHKGTFRVYNLFSGHRLCSPWLFQKCLTSQVNTTLCGCCCCCSSDIYSPGPGELFN